MKTEIQIIEKKTGHIVERIDVTGESERSIERVIAGACINLNHDEYFTRTVEIPEIEKEGENEN